MMSLEAAVVVEQAAAAVAVGGIVNGSAEVEVVMWVVTRPVASLLVLAPVSNTRPCPGRDPGSVRSRNLRSPCLRTARLLGRQELE